MPRAAAAPTAGQALFVSAGEADVEWADAVTTGTAARLTWSADLTLGRAAALAARCVRASARPGDDGKYAKYTPAGFVLARADEGVSISNGAAAAGSRGGGGHSPAGASGTWTDGAAGSGANDGARGTTTQGREGGLGTSAGGDGGAGGRVEGGAEGPLGAAGAVRGALTPKLLADATRAGGTGLFAPRAADGSMPALHAIAATGYTLGVSGFVLAYGVASEATALGWDVHVLVDAAHVLVDERAGQACPSGAYREYALAATPPACIEFRITFTGIAGTSTALVSVLAL